MEMQPLNDHNATKRPWVTLLTDFGTRDGYVGALKGVLCSVAPGAQVVDIAHDIEPQEVEAAAWCVATYWDCFPPGAIHLAVVDPGVGGDREGLVARVDGRFLVGPDNGLFSYPLLQGTDVDVRWIKPDTHRPGPVSNTFHGRDIFAYTAGKLALDPAGWQDLTDPADSYTLLALTEAEYEARRVSGIISHVDRYGNLITNIRAEQLPPDAQWVAVVGGAEIAVRDIKQTYANVPEGQPVVLIGSYGYVEIAVRNGSAQRVFNVEAGKPVCLKRLGT